MTAVVLSTPLACRLRPRTGGRSSLPVGEIELENVSASPVEIRHRSHPLEHLALSVADGEGAVVSAGSYGDSFSPAAEEQTLRLLPGESYRSAVSLFATVPAARRRPGAYTVRAAYEYGGARAVAAPLEVTWSGEPPR